MTVVFGPNDLLVTFIWQSPFFASGGAATRQALGLNAPPDDTTGALVVEVIEAWDSTLQPTMDNECVLAGARWESQTLSGFIPANVAGGFNVASPAPNTSILTTFRATGKSRRTKGRQYWPMMIGEGDIDQRGAISQVYYDGLAALYDDYVAALLTIPGVDHLAIAQTETDEQQSPPFVPWPEVSTWGLSPLVATQRRRLRR